MAILLVNSVDCPLAGLDGLDYAEDRVANHEVHAAQTSIEVVGQHPEQMTYPLVAIELTCHAKALSPGTIPDLLEGHLPFLVCQTGLHGP